MTSRSIALAAVLLITVPGCNGDATGPSYNPDIPAVWASAVTNGFFPLVPGTILQYSGQTAQGLETTTVEVLSTTKLVNGVPATVVLDRVYLDGSLIEETYDWYAQDADGNVWYLGEDSKEIDNGQVVSTEGSWEWGVDGALPGINMWADPTAHVGEKYRQEFYRGVAEDFGKIIAVDQSITVPAGSFTGCIRTEDWVGLDPGAPREHKTYCPQVGQVLETGADGSEPIELISQTP